MTANSASGSAARFVGQRVPRKEDRRLLTGNGQYVDDIALPGMLDVVFVRSQIARGRIRSIDVEAARSAPGVKAVLTAKDFADAPPEIFAVHGGACPMPKIDILAVEQVRYVGQPIAMIIAENRYLAEDAAALVYIDCTMETPVITIADARDGAPVHPEFANNEVDRASTPDDPEIDSVFASAAHVVEATIQHQRQAHAPMETRGIVAHAQPGGGLLVYASCQSPYQAAYYLARSLKMDTSQVRVIAKDVGGAFGLKVQFWLEEVAVAAAALRIGRPLKWIEDRLENLTSAGQAREQEIHCRYAFDAAGRILAADFEYYCNIGAFSPNADCNFFVLQLLPGPYRVPHYRYRTINYYSNTVGQAAYRGPWAMETLAREVMIELGARKVGIAPEELRRRNLVTKAEQPFTLVTGSIIDDVSVLECHDEVVSKIDMAAFRAEQAKARQQGRYIGIGFSVYVEPTTMGFGVNSTESAHIRIDPSGQVIASLGTHSQGHGTETTMAQVIADHLGVDVGRVTVQEDDSSRGGMGGGAGGSRQAVAGGGAAIQASAQLAAKVKRIAGFLLNANPELLVIEDGIVFVPGVPESTMPLSAVAATAYFDPDRLPPDMDPGLEVAHRFRPPPIVFSNAAHACVCEVEADTGFVKILRWIAGEDCGTVINPAVVEGQIAGGIAQGIGGVLLEEISYDDMGNPMAATFKDYVIPSVHDVPEIEYCHLSTPSSNVGGFKGVGEGGAIVAPPALVNAIADALAPFGDPCLNLPLTPSKLMEVMERPSLVAA